MADEIIPALMPGEWAAPWWILGEGGFVNEGLLWWDGARFVVGYDSGCVSQVVDATPVQMMAVANAVLPDDSPYKITRDWIALLSVAQVEARKAVGVDCINGPCDECRAACERFCARLQRMADVITALLPPE